MKATYQTTVTFLPMYQTVDASGSTIRGTQTSSAALETKFTGEACTATKRAEKKENKERRVKCMAAGSEMDDTTGEEGLKRVEANVSYARWSRSLFKYSPEKETAKPR